MIWARTYFSTPSSHFVKISTSPIRGGRGTSPPRKCFIYLNTCGVRTKIKKKNIHPTPLYGNFDLPDKCGFHPLQMSNFSECLQTESKKRKKNTHPSFGHMIENTKFSPPFDLSMDSFLKPLSSLCADFNLPDRGGGSFHTLTNVSFTSIRAE